MQSCGTRFAPAITALLILASGSQGANAQAASDRGSDTAVKPDQSKGLPQTIPSFSTNNLHIQLTVTTDWKVPCMQTPSRIAEVRLLEPDGKDTLLLSITSDQVFTGDSCEGATTLSIGQTLSGKAPGQYRLRVNAQPIFYIVNPHSGLFGSASLRLELETAGPFDQQPQEVLKMDIPSGWNGVPQVEFVFDFK